MLLMVLLMLILITVTTVLMYNSSRRGHVHPTPPPPSNVGGIYNVTTAYYFATAADAQMAFTEMQTITNGCLPPPPPNDRGVYNYVKIGSLASTAASWQQYQEAWNGTSPGECVFYGLLEAAERTGYAAGPADLCQAYVSATLQFFAVTRLTSLQRANLFQNLIAGVLVAWPLNMYFQNSLGANWQVTIANEMLSVINGFTGNLARLGTGDIQAIATQHCNAYFASDQPAYYNSALQPYLAYPFQGLINKQASTFAGDALQGLLGDLEIPAGGIFKAVYIVDPNGVLAADPAVQLFLQSTVGGTGAPVTVLSTSVAVSLQNIVASIYLVPGVSVDPAKVPVLVVGRYVDDAQAYQTVSVTAAQLQFALSPQDPTGYLQGQDLGLLLHNAASFASMSVMDFDEAWPWEAGLGAGFQPSKFVSDAVNLLMNTPVYAGTVAAQSLLDTFEIKNTLVAGVDVGGRLAGQQFLASLAQQGLSAGLHRMSFAMQLQIEVATPYNTSVAAATAQLLGDAAGGSGGYNSAAWPAGMGGESPITPGVPAQVDLRVTYPGCIPPVVNQGSCDCCWAIASSHAVAANMCIQKGVQFTGGGFVSAQQIITCSIGVVTSTQGCAPQGAMTGFSFLEGDATSDKCQPYTANTPTAPGCKTQCVDGSRPPLVGGIAQGSAKLLQTPADVKAALAKGQYVASAFMIPDDFTQFFPVTPGTPSHNTGVYPIKPSINFAGSGLHMVPLVGYNDAPPAGTPPYWIMENSWSQYQCDGGFCNMQQDLAGVVTKNTMWFGNFAVVATPRVDATAPAAAVAIAAQASSTISQTANAPGTQPSIFTSTVSCPTVVLNSQQSASSAAIQGCPNSAQQVVQRLTSSSSSSSHSSAPRSTARPEGGVLSLFTLTLAVVLPLLLL